jgi:hypothetical protein
MEEGRRRKSGMKGSLDDAQFWHSHLLPSSR